MKNEVFRKVVSKMRTTLALLSVLTLLGAGGAFAQITMGVGSSTAKVGDTVDVPINVTNFNNVGAISIKLGYSSTAGKFVGVTGAPTGVVFTSNAANNVITLGWFDATTTSPINISSGVLVKVRVVFLGGTETFTFDAANSEIANGSGTVLPITYSGGSISPIALGMTLGSVQGKVNSAVTVPINVTNFTSVGAVSIKIQYDPAVLQFDSVANQPSSMQFTKGAAGGVITLGWFDGTGNTPVTIGSAKLLDLKFTYKGGISALTFIPAQSEIANGSGNIFTVNYTAGQVSPAPGEALTLALPDVHLASGANVVLPLTVVKFSTVGAISVKIQYNAAVLTFNNLTNAAVTGITTNASNGILTLAWFDPTGTTPLTVGTAGTGKLADLNFTYNGGTTALTFVSAQTEISNGTGVAIPAAFTNGSVSLNVKPVFVSRIPAKLDSVALNLKYKIAFKVSAADANNDTLTYTWKLNNATVQTSRDSTYQLGAFTASGVQKLVCLFADNGGLVDSTVWNIVAGTGVTRVEPVANVPAEFSLGQNYPNPFNPSTTISFALPQASPVTLEIYNILGAKVRTLLSGTMMSAASHSVVWDGKNDVGSQVASGMYLYRISADKHVSTMKMLLMK